MRCRKLKNSQEPEKPAISKTIAILTFRTTVELHSHRDVTIPSPRKNLNKARLDWWIEPVLYYCVLVSVGCEILK